MTDDRSRRAVRQGLLFWCVGAVAMSGVLYLLACCLPAVGLENRDTPAGVMLLLFGWCGVFNGDAAWCANPMLWLSWLFLILGTQTRRLWVLAALLGFGAVLLGLTTTIGSTFYTDEGGHSSKVTALLIGARLWLTSLLLPAAAAFLAWVVSLLLPGETPANATHR